MDRLKHKATLGLFFCWFFDIYFSVIHALPVNDFKTEWISGDGLARQLIKGN